jgi:hypothetical protein
MAMLFKMMLHSRRRTAVGFIALWAALLDWAAIADLTLGDKYHILPYTILGSSVFLYIGIAMLAVHHIRGRIKNPLP